MYKRIFPQLLLIAIASTSFSKVFSQENLPDLVRRVKPAVVAIVTYDEKGDALTTGSGFFIRPGQVVTNLHVMRGARRSEVKTLDGKGKVFTVAGTLAIDEEGDLALLRVNMPPERPRSNELARGLPDEGEKIFVIGNPLKLEGSVSDGIVSAVREVPGVGKIIQITAPISHGNSGSPIFNLKGQVVGVVTVKVTNGQNINLAISADRVRELRPGKLRSWLNYPRRTSVPTWRSCFTEQASILSGWVTTTMQSVISKMPSTEIRNGQMPGFKLATAKLSKVRMRKPSRAYQQALQLKPESEEVLNKLGDAYYYAGRLGEAIESYKEAARLHPAERRSLLQPGLGLFREWQSEAGAELRLVS